MVTEGAPQTGAIVRSAVVGEHGCIICIPPLAGYENELLGASADLAPVGSAVVRLQGKPATLRVVALTTFGDSVEERQTAFTDYVRSNVPELLTTRTYDPEQVQLGVGVTKVIERMLAKKRGAAKERAEKTRTASIDNTKQPYFSLREQEELGMIPKSTL